MYAHKKIVKIIEEFNSLITTETKEEVFQKFIEKNLLLLSKYHAKNIYIKPNILGKFKSDFAILDSSNCLKLIELENPHVKLFKKNREQSQKLTHAYYQVVDWLDEYSKNHDAFLECFNLVRNQITLVNGVIIMGYSRNEDYNCLQRHYSNPPYKDIELTTFDELSNSVLEISKKLA